ncbi:MAG: putative repeat protein (TIGR03847 family) [Glaciecola sp.]|jgi:uncharacterized repeat protein (TIGR03847 family)
MPDLELTDPQHLTANFTGQPGERVFYLQAEDDNQRLDVQVEKGQVAGIGELLEQLLLRLGDTPATDWDRAVMALREPLEPRWRVGELALGMDPDRGRFVLDLTEFDQESSDEDLETARIWLTQDQARRLAAHAAECVGKGRPPGETSVVKDITGKVVFPSTNGHGKIH